jgi:hypothetical protein
MKVLGFVVIVLGLIMVYVGITGSQHTLMATLTGKTTPVSSGQSINPSGAQNAPATSNTPPTTVSNGGSSIPAITVL